MKTKSKTLPIALLAIFSVGTLLIANAQQDELSITAKQLQTGRLGLVAVTKNFQPGEKAWIELLTTAKSMGTQVLALQPGIWSKTEPRPGVYRWQAWDKLFGIMDRHGFDFEITKDIGGPFFMDQITAPEDIEFKSFTDPVLLTRYQGYIGSYLKHFGERTDYLVIHAEGSHMYFKKHPDQLEDYCRFLELMTEFVHKHSPGTRVGVNVYPRNTDLVLSSMAAAVDFLAFDTMSGKNKEPEQLPEIVSRMIRLAGDKPIAIQYAAWSTSRIDLSSEEEQVRFIRAFFETLETHRKKILYAAFARVFDNDMALTRPGYRAAFPKLSDAELDKVVDSMCHFGLRRADGSPKPGWHAFLRYTDAYYKRR